MYKEEELQIKKGIRCSVCNGCGRCPGVVKKMQVLSETRVEHKLSLHNEDKKRLVTVDIGTTTIAMQLYDEDGGVTDTYCKVNPQTVYGADVISRIRAAENQEQADRMRQLVLAVLENGIQRFQRKLQPGEQLHMVLAANTTMVYLLMGWNPAELGAAPFHATHLEKVQTTIAQIPCDILPGLSAFVGGDIVAGIYASGMLTADKPILLIDLGTNGEMVLGNHKKLIACATAAGPAFEGGVNRGIWGADMISLLATLYRMHIMDETGLLEETYFHTGIRIGDVCVTQDAIRAIQLAKGAIGAGIEILLEEYGLQAEEIGDVILAGGFGYYLKPEDAACIGLLPQSLAAKAQSGGNTALAGALCYGKHVLLNGKKDKLQLFREQGNSICVLNLAEHPKFQEKYYRFIDFN